MTPEQFMEELAARGIHRQVDAAEALASSQSSISRWCSGTAPITRRLMLALQSIPKRNGQGDPKPNGHTVRKGLSRNK